MIGCLMAADFDADGKISREEAPPQSVDRSDRADANADNYLDRSELEALLGRRRPGGR